MISRVIAQAIVGEGPFLCSASFDPSWQERAEEIATDYSGQEGQPWPEALFALPFGRRHVAVVSVAGRRFRFLILARVLFDIIPDPFAIADRFPPDWGTRGLLPDCEWPEQPLPRRTVSQLDQIFREGDGPLLLGACQTLVDSGRFVLVRERPAEDLLRQIWALLPDSTRQQTWFGTWTPNLALPWSVAVVPRLPAENLPSGYLTEDQARDYPESRYERELQTAVEAGDQKSLDRLLARRSSRETLRLALWLVLGMAALSLLTRIVMSR